jgi:transposase
MLEAKGKERGRVEIAVDPRRESRPDQATFRCTASGLELNADHNTTKNILQRALKG